MKLGKDSVCVGGSPAVKVSVGHKIRDASGNCKLPFGVGGWRKRNLPSDNRLYYK